MGAPAIHSTARSPTQAELLARQGRAPPLPAVEAQRETVAEIEAYQKAVDGALVVLDNYRPRSETRPASADDHIGEVRPAPVCDRGDEGDRSSRPARQRDRG